MRLRPAFVVTTVAALATTACVSTCPEKIENGQSCSSEGKECHRKEGCGSNGYRCEKGKWRELMTYCNPPPPDTPEKPEPPPQSDAGTTTIGPPTVDAAAAASTCSDNLTEGAPCSPEGQKCSERPGCGPNGFVCREGKWHMMMTYCNPPPRPPTRNPPARPQ